MCDKWLCLCGRYSSGSILRSVTELGLTDGQTATNNADRRCACVGRVRVKKSQELRIMMPYIKKLEGQKNESAGWFWLLLYEIIMYVLTGSLGTPRRLYVLVELEHNVKAISR